MDRATGPAELDQGWRGDPWQTHEFRYFSGGEATSWVSSAGAISEETVVSVDELLRSAWEPSDPPFPLAPVALPSADPSEGWRDVWQTHEFRYFSDGEATSWVSSGGVVREEIVVSVDKLVDAMAWDSRATGFDADGSPSSPTTNRMDMALTSWDHQGQAEDAGAGVPPRRRRRPPRARGTPRTARRGAAVGAVVGALVLASSWAAFAATHGGQPVRASARTHVAATSTADPAAPTSTSTSTVPSATSPLGAWWAGTGQPDTLAFVSGLQELSGLAGNSDALLGACRTFGVEVASSSAPPAPAASIQREWQLTMSTVNRVARACAAGRYAQGIGDLQPASYTIHDLTNQITSSLNGS